MPVTPTWSGALILASVRFLPLGFSGQTMRPAGPLPKKAQVGLGVLAKDPHRSVAGLARTKARIRLPLPGFGTTAVAKGVSLEGMQAKTREYKALTPPPTCSTMGIAAIVRVPSYDSMRKDMMEL
jgi:hypothetical protein